MHVVANRVSQPSIRTPLRSFVGVQRATPILVAISLAGILSASCITDGSSEEACEDCSGANVVWGCYGGVTETSDKYKGSVCVPNTWIELEVKDECNLVYGGPFWTCRGVTPNPCGNNGGGGTGANASESSCNDWDPDDEVTLNSSTGVFEINESFVDYIVADTMRLVNCDVARVEFIASANEFKVKSASSGTLLYELGFRNDDVISSVNRQPLDSHSDAGSAFGILYLHRGETEYAFEVIRGSSTITVEVEVVS